MLETIRRDVAMLWRGLVRGQTPPYLATSQRSGRRTYAMPTRVLEVVSVSRTESDLTLWLATDDGSPLVWDAGQFLTLLYDVDGQQCRRAYSLSSDPADSSRGRITIRAIPQGRMSQALYQTAQVGMTIRALGPSGRFVWPVAAGDAAGPLLLVGGGSGLTPLMSILLAAIRAEHPSITLVYANREGDEGLYSSELETLAQTHANFTLDRVSGHLAAVHLQKRLAPDVECFVCGPQGLMEVAAQALADHPPQRVHTESFHTVSSSPVDTSAQPAVFEVGGQRYEATVGPGETLLEAGLRVGAPLPFSCAMGGCGACRMTLTSGQVASETPNCLSAKEQADGGVLTCVARPLCPVTVDGLAGDDTGVASL